MHVIHMTLEVNINYLHKRPRINSICNGEKLCFTVRYELAHMPHFGQAMPMIRKNNPRQISKFRVVKDLRKMSPRFSFPDETFHARPHTYPCAFAQHSPADHGCVCPVWRYTHDATLTYNVYRHPWALAIYPSKDCCTATHGPHTTSPQSGC
jgi:hypothetical protein